MAAPFDRTELITLAKGKAAASAAATELGKICDGHPSRSEKATIARALRACGRDQ